MCVPYARPVVDRDRLLELVRRVDEALPGRAVVFGSLPPEGRDLDVIARPAEADAVARALDAAGLERKGESWALLADCSAYLVELARADAWGAPAELFDEATPLEHCTNLCAPAPHHAALLLARVVDRSGGGLSAKRRARLDAVLGRDPGALEEARRHAPAWRAERELAALDALHSGDEEPRRRRLPRLRRGAVVTLSGLDGAGKSSQATALREALDRLGVDAVVIWAPVEGHPLLNLVGRPLKRLLGRDPSSSVMSAPAAGGSGGGGSAARRLWTTFVTLVHAAEQRRLAFPHLARGRVVVFDRHVLDAVVRLRFTYGDTGGFRLQKTLIRLVSPRARLAYYLEIRPETSLARKDDVWSLAELSRHAELYREELPGLGVRRLDGERPREELCAEIARDVWRALG